MQAITENTSSNRLITDKFEAFWFETKIFYVRLYKDAVLEAPDIQEMLQFQKEQKLNSEHLRIIHAEKFATITKRAREYLQDNATTVKAEAYIIPSLSQKILFNLYVKLRSNKNTIKAFENLDDSLVWLKKIQTKRELQ